jgi:hypothetical protein
MKQNSTIKTRTRKCKGVNLAKGFEGCGEQKIHHRFGLCSSCFAKWLYNTPEGHKYLERMKIKAKKEVERKQKADWRKRYKKGKDELMTIGERQAILQEEVNTIVKLIDKGLPCLARNYYPGQIHAGHVFARGGNSTIKFNLHNIHRQSAQSNKWQNDDGLLREGIEKEYGKEYMEFISQLRRTPELKYTHEEYKELIVRARKLVTEYQARNRTYSKAERIEHRNRVNALLGIYAPEFCEYKQPQAQ